MTYTSRMFPFVSRTWNPLGGECRHGCEYCWARKLATRFMNKKYSGDPRIFEREFSKYLFRKGEVVFVCDMCDLFGDWVPSALIQRIIDYVAKSEATFLFLTKNPKRYAEFAFPPNCMLGATIETDSDNMLACAPKRSERLQAMAELQFPRKMVSIEPIMKFKLDEFLPAILKIKPELVAIGYDNYRNKLPEPCLAMAELLAKNLEAHGVKVYRKTMREKVEVLP